MFVLAKGKNKTENPQPNCCGGAGGRQATEVNQPPYPAHLASSHLSLGLQSEWRSTAPQPLVNSTNLNRSSQNKKPGLKSDSGPGSESQEKRLQLLGAQPTTLFISLPLLDSTPGTERIPIKSNKSQHIFAQRYKA